VLKLLGPTTKPPVGRSSDQSLCALPGAVTGDMDPAPSSGPRGARLTCWQLRTVLPGAGPLVGRGSGSSGAGILPGDRFAIQTILVKTFFVLVWMDTRHETARLEPDCAGLGLPESTSPPRLASPAPDRFDERFGRRVLGDVLAHPTLEHLQNAFGVVVRREGDHGCVG
jgi:hypothetical protein